MSHTTTTAVAIAISTFALAINVANFVLFRRRKRDIQDALNRVQQLRRRRTGL